MAGIKDYSTTAANNTTVNSVSIAEGMSPSGVNNALREMNKNSRDAWNDKEWFILGDEDQTTTFTRASSTSVTVGSDISTSHHVGRRIKIVGTNTGTIFGKIATSSYSSPNTTITFTFDSGSINASDSTVDVYVGSTFTNPSNPVVDEDDMTSNSAILPPSQQSTKAFVTSGTVTMTNKSIDLTDNTLTGTTAEFNTALSDGSFATLAGTETLTNKTIDASQLTGSVANARLDAQLQDVAGLAVTDGNFIVGDGANFVAESGSTARTSLGLGSIATQDSTNISVTGGSITGLGDPSATSDAATKNYVDQAVAGLRTRIVAEAATTANITISTDLQNGDTIDGVTLATGDRVLVKDQTTASQNGLYTVVASGSASRDTEYDTIAELSGQMVVVNQGTSNDNKIFLCTTNSDATLGTDNITFTQVTPSNTGTVTSVGVQDSGASEFTITGSPVTTSGNISLAINSINANKIHDGNVSNTEFGYLNGVTSGIQSQIDGKIGNLSEDSTPELGGTLNANGNNIQFDNSTGIADVNNNAALEFQATASAVNELTITNAATGNGPELSSTGSDTNIDLKITPKGTGKINLDGIKFPNADGTSGQVLQTNGSGVLSFADAGGGKIGQVVQVLDATTFSTTSTSYVDVTGVSASITPSSTSSKVLVIVQGACNNSTASGEVTRLKLLRGSTAIGIANTSHDSFFNTYGGSNLALNFTSLVLDSPSTTSATTYKIQVKQSGSSTAYVGGFGSGDEAITTITLMEILA
jgi:hypothetical protein